MIEYLIEDLPEYVSRGQRIRSVLEGSGSVEILPGRPDVQAARSDWSKGEKYDPDIDFDPNSYSRMDKFDALEVGQELIDRNLDLHASQASSASDSNSEEKK